jgi:hypothetical protein
LLHDHFRFTTGSIYSEINKQIVEWTNQMISISGKKYAPFNTHPNLKNLNLLMHVLRRFDNKNVSQELHIKFKNLSRISNKLPIAYFYKFFSHLYHLEFKFHVAQSMIIFLGFQDNLVVALPGEFMKHLGDCFEMAWEGILLAKSLLKDDHIVQKQKQVETHLEGAVSFARHELMFHIMHVLAAGCRYLNRAVSHPILDIHIPQRAMGAADVILPNIDDEELGGHQERVFHYQVCFVLTLEMLSLFRENTIKTVMTRCLTEETNNLFILGDVLQDTVYVGYYLFNPSTLLVKLKDAQAYLMFFITKALFDTKTTSDDIGAREMFELFEKSIDSMRYCIHRVEEVYLPLMNDPANTSIASMTEFWTREEVKFHRLVSRMFHRLGQSCRTQHLQYLKDDDVDEDEKHDYDYRFDYNLMNDSTEFDDDVAECQKYIQLWKELIPSQDFNVVDDSATTPSRLHWKQEWINIDLMLRFGLFSDIQSPIWWVWSNDLCDELWSLSTVLSVLINKSSIVIPWPPVMNPSNVTNGDLLCCMMFWLGKYLEIKSMEDDEMEFIITRLARQNEVRNKVKCDALTARVANIFQDTKQHVKLQCDVFLMSEEENESILSYFLKELAVTDEQNLGEIKIHVTENLKMVEDFLNKPIDASEVPIFALVVEKIHSLSIDELNLKRVFAELAEASNKLHQMVLEETLSEEKTL